MINIEILIPKWSQYMLLLLCPLNRRGWGDILLFVPILLASCLHSVSWTNDEFWPNLHRHIIGIGERKKWLDFGDLVPIFKVKPALWIIKFWRQHPCSFLSALYLLNQLVDFDQTWTVTLVGRGKEVIRFWWLWPHFQGHTSTSNYQFRRRQPRNFFSALCLLNQWMDFDQTCTDTLLGWWKEEVRF